MYMFSYALRPLTLTGRFSISLSLSLSLYIYICTKRVPLYIYSIYREKSHSGGDRRNKNCSPAEGPVLASIMAAAQN